MSSSVDGVYVVASGGRGEVGRSWGLELWEVLGLGLVLELVVVPRVVVVYGIKKCFAHLDVI